MPRVASRARRLAVALGAVAALVLPVAFTPAAGATGNPGCGQCGVLSPAGGSTFVLTVYVGAKYEAMKEFVLRTGMPVTNLRPAGVCAPHGTASEPENNVGTYYNLRCVEKVKPGSSVQICFDGGGKLPNVAGTPVYSEYLSPGLGQYGNDVIEGTPVSGCPFGSGVKNNATACVVPALKGKSLGAARSALARAHCATGSVRRARSTRVKKGLVISQQAKAGTHKPTGSRVGLLVSSGK